MNRRRYLALLGASTTLSGCLEGPRTDDGSSGLQGSTGTPRGSAVNTGSDPYTRIRREGERLSVNEVAHGELSGFTLDAAADSAPVGGTLAFQLVNRSGRERTIGARSLFDVQERTADGWRSIFYYRPRLVYKLVGLVMEAGDELTWRLRMTHEALSHYAARKSELLVACSPLTPGTYRFVYWGGVPTDSTSDPANQDIGVKFELTERDGG